jgi:hypothetical protein
MRLQRKFHQTPVSMWPHNDLTFVLCWCLFVVVDRDYLVLCCPPFVVELALSKGVLFMDGSSSLYSWLVRYNWCVRIFGLECSGIQVTDLSASREARDSSTIHNI